MLPISGVICFRHMLNVLVNRHFSVVGNFTARPAKLVRDCEMTAPCGTTILHPTSVVATFIVSKLYVTPRALFDVLSPPYCSEDGRHCSYYRMIPRTRRDLDGEFSFLFFLIVLFIFVLWISECKCWWSVLQTRCWWGWSVWYKPGTSGMLWCLEEIQPPESFVMQRGLYKGPNIRR